MASTQEHLENALKYLTPGDLYSPYTARSEVEMALQHYNVENEISKKEE